MKLALCVLLSAVSLEPSALAVDYYVSPTGSSANTGLTTDTPWPLQYALNSTVAGMTLNLLPGLYSGQYAVDTHSGTAGNPITIRSSQCRGRWLPTLPMQLLRLCGNLHQQCHRPPRERPVD